VEALRVLPSQLLSSCSPTAPLSSEEDSTMTAQHSGKIGLAQEVAISSRTITEQLGQEALKSSIDSLLAHVSSPGKELHLHIVVLGIAQTVAHSMQKLAKACPDLPLTTAAAAAGSPPPSLPLPSAAASSLVEGNVQPNNTYDTATPGPAPVLQQLHVASTLCHGMLQLLQRTHTAGLMQRMSAHASAVADMHPHSTDLNSLTETMDMFAVVGGALHGSVLVDLAAHVQVCGAVVYLL